jgi:two-component system nitrate/nitrite response regulator NarL
VASELDARRDCGREAIGALNSDRGAGETRVLIVGSVRIYCEGLAFSIAKHSSLNMVAHIASYLDAIESALLESPDIILLDVSPPNALSLVGALLAAAPECKIVAFGIEDSDETVLSFTEAGVIAFAAREGSIADLIALVQSAARNEVVWSPRRNALICRRLATLAMAQHPTISSLDLTTRERQIVDCIDRGMSNKEIAAEFGIEVATVKNHVHNMLEKLQVHRRGEAAARVRECLPAGVSSSALRLNAQAVARS